MSTHLPDYSFLIPSAWPDYALVDSGDGQRLERFGRFTLVRPEVEAVWQKSLSEREWSAADATFVTGNEPNGGHWTTQTSMPESWQITYGHLKLKLQLGGSKQVGIFPEQAGQWQQLEQVIGSAGRPVRVLNLFGYTGVASLVAAAAGATVTHVNSSRKVVEWGKDNQQASAVNPNSIRWIVDDALKFVRREVNRAARYDGIIMDPPKFGRGPKGEVWEFYKWLPMLLQTTQRLLSEQPLFYLTTAYAVKASAVTLMQGMREIAGQNRGTYQLGETLLQEQSAGRLLSTSIYCMWISD